MYNILHKTARSQSCERHLRKVYSAHLVQLLAISNLFPMAQRRFTVPLGWRKSGVWLLIGDT